MMFKLEDINHLKDEILADASNRQPVEACGYIINQKESFIYYSCRNYHEDPNDNFLISNQDYAIAESTGEIVAVVHSHTDATEYNGKQDFSEADKVICETLGIPWVLLVLPQQEFKLMHPSGYQAPLIGREFIYGVFDCYSLIKDAFKEINIFLGDYPRNKLNEWVDDPNWNLFEQNFEQEGFVPVLNKKHLKKHDVLLMEIKAKRINHIGLIWEPDKNIFIHQLVNYLSRKEVYGGYWRDRTVRIVRHKSLW